MRRIPWAAICAFVLLGVGSPPVFAGTLEGTVTPLDAAQEVEVCIAELPPGARCVVPKADGSYVFSGLEGQYKIEFVPTYRSGLLTQFYDHKSTFAEASPVSVGKFGAITGVDADLLPGGVIAGNVSAVGGQALDEVEVCATPVGPSSIKSCGETGPSGAYELHSLPTGSYRVGFWGQGASAEYAPEYFDDKASLGQASSVAVTAGSITPSIDAALEKGAQIRGFVTAALGGAALGGIPVCVFPAVSTAAEACVETTAGGGYALIGLREGSYQVGFDLGAAEIGGTGVSATVGGFLPQYYDGVSTRAAAQTLSLGPGQVLEGVDAALLAPTPPQPSPPVPPTTSPLVAAAPPIAEPKPPAKGCKKGYRKRKVKGRSRCVRRKHSGRSGANRSHDPRHG